MIRTSPFHKRTSALNETGLWEHWSGTLAANRYQMSDKFEYFAVRNAAGVFDSSPLYKYRITGPDAERFLAGVLARDIRTCAPGNAQYTAWCDDRGFVDRGRRHPATRRGRVPADRRRTEPRLVRGPHRARSASRSRRSATRSASSPSRARARATCSRVSSRRSCRLPFFGLARATIAGVPVTISRTGYSGDLGYEVWVPARSALKVWDAMWSSFEGYGVLPFGLDALYMLRIEAGLLLLDVDFTSSRFGWTDEDRSTPIELGWSWMLRGLADDDRAFIGRRAIEREIAEQDLALAPDRPHRRLGRLRPDVRPGRAHPAQGPHADPRRVLRLRRRRHPGRLRHEPDVLADAPAAHRADPRPPGARGTRVTRSSSSSTSTTATSTSTARTARLPLYNPARKTA